MNKMRMASLISAVTLAAVSCTAAAESGSWNHINQTIERPEGWQCYVESSPFVLGESVPAGEINGTGIFTRDWGSYPSIDGSTVCVPMAMELARQHLQMQEGDLQSFVCFSTTHSAYERLINRKANPTVTLLSENAMMDDTHPVDLILATAPSDEELAMAAEAGVELMMVPFCYDAFVFLVNAQNPVDNLTVSQIRDIYTGKTREWGAVGGAKDLSVIPYQRPKNSGSQTAMETLVMQGVPLSGAADNYVADFMGTLLERVGDYDNGPAALGYSYLYYVNDLYHVDAIKVLAVDGIAPTTDNLRSGAYPFTTCYYAVYRKGDANAAAFAEWLQGSAGQSCVRQAGYIPYADK